MKQFRLFQKGFSAAFLSMLLIHYMTALLRYSIVVGPIMYGRLIAQLCVITGAALLLPKLFDGLFPENLFNSRVGIAGLLWFLVFYSITRVFFYAILTQPTVYLICGGMLVIIEIWFYLIPIKATKVAKAPKQ